MSMKLIKMMAAAQEVPKLLLVCISCTDEHHCLTAMQYLAQFTKKHPVVKETIVINAIVHNLVSYLQDTRDHARNGWHKPEHAVWNTMTTFPDINDYVGGILGCRLPSTWARNTKLHLSELRLQ